MKRQGNNMSGDLSSMDVALHSGFMFGYVAFIMYADIYVDSCGLHSIQRRALIYRYWGWRIIWLFALVYLDLQSLSPRFGVLI